MKNTVEKYYFCTVSKSYKHHAKQGGYGGCIPQLFLLYCYKLITFRGNGGMGDEIPQPNYIPIVQFLGHMDLQMLV